LLQFVLGRAGSGKTEYLRELLAEKNRQGGEKLMMLVPEQYSFETEKAILHKAGPVRAASIQVYSFTRLAEAVFRGRGRLCGTQADRRRQAHSHVFGHRRQRGPSGGLCGRGQERKD